MSRRRRAKKRQVTPDSRYGDVIIGKFIRSLMLQGKITKASSLLYSALDILSSKVEEEQVAALHKALENVSPKVEVRSKRVGGATYQVPVEVQPHRRMMLARRWIINSARSKSGSSMDLRLAAELVDAYNERGAAFKKKEDVHKMAESNKAFSHLRFSS